MVLFCTFVAILAVSRAVLGFDRFILPYGDIILPDGGMILPLGRMIWADGRMNRNDAENESGIRRNRLKGGMIRQDARIALPDGRMELANRYPGGDSCDDVGAGLEYLLPTRPTPREATTSLSAAGDVGAGHAPDNITLQRGAPVRHGFNPDPAGACIVPGVGADGTERS